MFKSIIYYNRNRSLSKEINRSGPWRSLYDGFVDITVKILMERL